MYDDIIGVWVFRICWMLATIILGLQCILWLKNGIWESSSTSKLFHISPIYTEWAGLNKIFNMFFDLSMSFHLILLPFVIMAFYYFLVFLFDKRQGL